MQCSLYPDSVILFWKELEWVSALLRLIIIIIILNVYNRLFYDVLPAVDPSGRAV